MTDISPGDIVLVDFGPILLNRKLAGKRPGILVYSEGDVALIIPFTSNLQRLKFKGVLLIEPDAYNNLAGASVAMVFQMQLFDARDVTAKLGTLSAKDKKSLNDILRKIILLK